MEFPGGFMGQMLRLISVKTIQIEPLPEFWSKNIWGAGVAARPMISDPETIPCLRGIISSLGRVR